ncbi:MAG: hypothetical protein QF483_08805 [Gammaproteobacteria bacterium]|jgi:hypothetical protein|nr:hypothetical protein [Gammaproteobacteria bacterium]MDP7153283.1 hypothetical protein [Gammaproteobacteria bacterium]MDP7297346.1 hypothetical protein [Gammaproteobacteria bacterium]MDP7419970.1 hypothetical protein [Gammaproteobacteria bacterium]HJP39349.1 hypothetical protein [Gammaproteobacteria bacterium]
MAELQQEMEEFFAEYTQRWNDREDKVRPAFRKLIGDICAADCRGCHLTCR